MKCKGVNLRNEAAQGTISKEKTLFPLKNSPMNAQNNKWMISTVALCGMIIGIGIGIGISQLPFFKARALQANVAQNPLEQGQQNQPVGAPSAMTPVSDKDHIRGNKDAKISLVVYSDTECPFCKRFHMTMLQLMKLYPNDVRWIYRHYPIDGLHPKARSESEALECAAALGGEEKFWSYLDRMMEITPANNGLPLEELPRIAAFVSLDTDKFNDCLKQAPHAAKIQGDVEDAERIGADGTPHSIFITPDGQKYPIKGYVDVTTLSKAVKQVLKI